MATQYTPILKLALPVTGELNGTWGDVVNDNITSMVEQAIAGLATINTWAANSHTLTTADGTTSESRCAMLVADDDGSGNPSAAATIVCPATSKLYILKNISGQTVTLKTAAGTGIAVPNNQTSFLFCDGTNVEACVTSIVDGNVSGNLTVQGNATVNGNTTLGNATTDTVTLTARIASVVSPSADNTYDLGSVANSWKDLYIDGTAYLALVDINGGTIDGTTIGGTTPAAGSFTNLAYTGTLTGGTGVINIGSGQVYKDASGNLGLATTSPATRLHLGGAANKAIRIDTALGNSAFYTGWQDAANIGVNRDPSSGTVTDTGKAAASIGVFGEASNSYITFATTATNNATPTERLRLDASGNLGLGVTPSAWNSDYRAVDLSNTGSVYGRSANIGVGIASNAFRNAATSWIYRTTGVAASYEQSSFGSHAWFTAPSGTAGTAITFTQAMTLTAAGNLGIGTTSPNAKLETVSAFGADAIRITRSGTPSQYGVIRYGAGGYDFCFDSVDSSENVTPQFAWRTSVDGTTFTERMRINASGDVRIGTTGTLAARLTLTGYSSANQFPDLSIVRSSSGTAIQTGPNITFNDGTSVNSTAIQITQGRFGIWNYGAGTWQEKLVVTSAGDVGIGTISPNKKFEVVGNGITVGSTQASLGSLGIDILAPQASIPAAQIRGYIAPGTSDLGNFGNGDLLIASRTSAGTSIRFITGTTPATRMMVDAAGQVGIGVTPTTQNAGSMLQIGAVTNIVGSSDTSFFSNNVVFNSGYKYITSNEATMYYQSNGQHEWYNAAAGTAGAAATLVNVMTLNASGWLGLSDSTPISRLHLNTDGNTYVGGITLQNGANQSHHWYLSTNTTSRFEIGSGSGAWEWVNGNGTKMTLNSSGDLGLGTTNPTYRLSVWDTGADHQLWVRNTGTAASDDAIILIQTSSTGATATISGLYLGDGDDSSIGQLRYNHSDNSMAFYANTAERVRINSSGALIVGKLVDTVTGAGLVNDPSGLIRITRAGTTSATMIQFANNGGTQVGSITTSGSATAYNTSSDYRLKEDVQPMTGALAKLAQLKPVTYKWKSDGSDGQGFIAHELQEVVPECVTGAKDGVDAEGNPEYQGVDTSFLVATLTAAIQELKAEFDAYKAAHP